MFQISEVEEAPAFNGRRSFLTLRGHPLRTQPVPHTVPVDRRGIPVPQPLQAMRCFNLALKHDRHEILLVDSLDRNCRIGERTTQNRGVDQVHCPTVCADGEAELRAIRNLTAETGGPGLVPPLAKPGFNGPPWSFNRGDA
jgi:hypothetical protein